MKRIISLILLTVIMVVSFGAAHAAEPAPGGPFATAFYVQNLETTTTTCIFTFYDASGNAVLVSDSFTVLGGSNKEVYTPSLTVDSGAYSGVVNCDLQVAAVVNFSDSNSGASHLGIVEQSGIWFAPNIYDNYYGYYTNVYAQNASSSPIDIKLEIFAAGTATPVYTNTKLGVPAYASVVWQQEGLVELAYNKSYSAKITGTGNIAPVVNVYDSPTTAVQLYSYNPFTLGATQIFVPSLYNYYYGFNTEMKVQNIGSLDAQIKITYSTGFEVNDTIAPNTGKAYYTPNILPVSWNKSYSAVVESTNGQPVVVVVNQSSQTGSASTYNGLSSGASTIFAPVLYTNYYTFNTEVTCQNLGTANTDITITYNNTGLPTAPTFTSIGITPGKTVSFYTPSHVQIYGYKGSGVITSSGMVPIGCVVNEGSSNISIIWDSQYTYNGVMK